MPKLKVMNLYFEKKNNEDIQNLRQQLPHLVIRTNFDEFIYEELD